MARQDQGQYDYDQYEGPPRDRRNNNQDQRGGNRNNQGNNPNNNQNRDKPQFKPPQSVKATAHDPQYQLVCRWSYAPDIIYWIPTTTYFVQGRGVVDGRSGIRRSQSIGYAFYESDGNLLYIQEKDPEYSYVHEQVKEWEDTISAMDRIVKEMNEPGTRRRNRSAARGAKSIVSTPNSALAWYLKWGMVAMVIFMLLIFFATRG